MINLEIASVDDVDELVSTQVWAFTYGLWVHRYGQNVISISMGN